MINVLLYPCVVVYNNIVFFCDILLPRQLLPIATADY